MNKYTITEEELKIWARLETYADLENDKEAIQWLRKLVSREKSWRKLKEAVDEVEDKINYMVVAQDLINATEKVYDEMVGMFDECWERRNDDKGRN